MGLKNLGLGSWRSLQGLGVWGLYILSGRGVGQLKEVEELEELGVLKG